MEAMTLINSLSSDQTSTLVLVGLLIIIIAGMILKFIKRTTKRLITVLICTWLSGSGLFVAPMLCPQQLVGDKITAFQSLNEEDMQAFKEKYNVIKKNGEIYVFEKLEEDSVLSGLQKTIITNFSNN